MMQASVAVILGELLDEIPWAPVVGIPEPMLAVIEEETSEDKAGSTTVTNGDCKLLVLILEVCC